MRKRRARALELTLSDAELATLRAAADEAGLCLAVWARWYLLRDRKLIEPIEQTPAKDYINGLGDDVRKDDIVISPPEGDASNAHHESDIVTPPSEGDRRGIGTGSNDIKSIDTKPESHKNKGLTGRKTVTIDVSNNPPSPSPYLPFLSPPSLGNIYINPPHSYPSNPLPHPPNPPPPLPGDDCAGSATEEFEAWWAWYPRKVGKGQARRAYATARRKASREALLDAVRSYPWGSTGKYCPHASTWLNGERWLDERTQLVDPLADGDWT